MADEELPPLDEALEHALQRMEEEARRWREHKVTLAYTWEDDGIHATCPCGFDILLGFHPDLSKVAIAVSDHWREVGLL